MAAELRVLETEREASRKSAIATLEEALNDAREGRVIACAVAIVRADGAANGSYSSSDCLPALIGAVEIVRHRLLRNI